MAKYFLLTCNAGKTRESENLCLKLHVKTFEMGILRDPAFQHPEIYAKECIAEVCQDLYTKIPHEILVLTAEHWVNVQQLGFG